VAEEPEGKPEEGAEKDSAPKAGGKGIGALLASPAAKIGVFIFLLGVNAIVSFIVVQKVIRPKVTAEEDAPVEETVHVVEEHGVPVPGELFVVSGLIINPAGTRATRYLRVSAALEFDAALAKDLGHELEIRQHQFKDVLISELSSRTVDELVDPRVKEEIRQELLARLNSSLSHGELSNLYFTEYVIQ
jgi:flagellar FliL protein